MFIKYLRRKAIAVTKSRVPDFVIGDPENPYMLRWWWLPRNKFFNVYIHRFLKDDDDRAMHDHPWPSFSIMCEGNIRENYIGHHDHGGEYSAFRNLTGGDTLYRPADFAHRIIVMPGANLPLTIFITGPRSREWGFLCPKGWRHWKDFVMIDKDDGDKGQVGRGCGEMPSEDFPTLTGHSVIHCRECGTKHHTSTSQGGYCRSCSSDDNRGPSWIIPFLLVSTVISIAIWAGYLNWLFAS